MAAEEQTDVLVVGAGPAGLAAAIALADLGLSVRVCDARALPIDKACGEGLMPAGLVRLADLGVLPLVDPGERHLMTGVRYRTVSGRTAEADFAEGAGWGLRRTELSRVLAARARQLRGIDLRDGARVRVVSLGARGVLADAGGERVRARLLVAADGLGSPLRRAAGLEKGGAGPWRYGLRRHFRLAPWTDRVEVTLGAGVEAYVTPTGAERIGVALLWDRRRLRDPGGAGLFERLLARFPELAERLAGAEALGASRGAGPFLRRTRAAAADGVCLVGDAAGYVDAVTGEGVSLALTEAIALAETAGRVLRRGDRPDRRHLEPYDRRVRAVFDPYARSTRAVLALSRRPRLAGGAVAALGRAPGLLSRLVSAAAVRP